MARMKLSEIIGMLRSKKVRLLPSKYPFTLRNQFRLGVEERKEDFGRRELVLPKDDVAADALLSGPIPRSMFQLMDWPK